MEEVKITSFSRNHSKFDEREMKFTELTFELSSQPSIEWINKLKELLVPSHFLNPYHFYIENNMIKIFHHWVELNELQNFVNNLQDYFLRTNRFFSDENNSAQALNKNINDIINNIKF